jgi:hypothetical protein
MGNWTNKAVPLDEIEFDGDKIQFFARRMLVEEMQLLSKYHDKASGKLKFDDPLEVCTVAQSFFPRALVGVKGLRSGEGVEMTIEDFLEASKEFYFVPLIGEVFAKLIAISTIKASAKNSVPPTPESSEALGGEKPATAAN